MATRCQPHGTRWLKYGSIQVIKAVCTMATATKEIVLSAERMDGSQKCHLPNQFTFVPNCTELVSW